MHNRITVVSAQAALAVAACGFTACAANASFSATLDGYSAGSYVSCGYNSALAWDSSASVTMWSIRAFQHDFTRTDSGAEVLSWCVELYQGVSVGSTYVWDEVAAEAVPSNGNPGPMGALRASVISDMFARWIDPVTGLIIGDLADRNAKSAAFQLAVWEIAHENFFASSATGIVSEMSLSVGAFRSAPSTGATAWYDAIQSSLGVGGFMTSGVYGWANASAQDQLALPPIPAPGAIALLALAGLSSRRRR